MKAKEMMEGNALTWAWWEIICVDCMKLIIWYLLVCCTPFLARKWLSCYRVPPVEHIIVKFKRPLNYKLSHHINEIYCNLLLGFHVKGGLTRPLIGKLLVVWFGHEIIYTDIKLRAGSGFYAVILLHETR